MATLGEMVRGRRLSLGLTQVDVQSRSHGVLSQNYISQVEMGKVDRPNFDKLESFAAILGLPLNELKIAAGYPVVEVSRPMEVMPVTRGSGSAPVDYYGGVPADVTRWGVIEAEERTLDVPLAFIGSRALDDLFLVTATGDCLSGEGIVRGTSVLCAWARGRMPHDGDVVIVRLNDEVTMKRWIRTDTGIELRDSADNVAATVDPTTGIEVLGIMVANWLIKGQQGA